MESKKAIQNKYFVCKLKFCPISHKYAMAYCLFILLHTQNIL